MKVGAGLARMTGIAFLACAADLPTGLSSGTGTTGTGLFGVAGVRLGAFPKIILVWTGFSGALLVLLGQL